MSLNPLWATSRDYLKRNGHNVAGLAQALPFKGETFDGLLSSWCVPLWLMNKEDEYIAAFSEVARVLKPGGMGFFYPIQDNWLGSETFHDILGATLGEQNYRFYRSTVSDWTLDYTKPDSNPNSKLSGIRQAIIDHGVRLELETLTAQQGKDHIDIAA